MFSVQNRLRALVLVLCAFIPSFFVTNVALADTEEVFLSVDKAYPTSVTLEDRQLEVVWDTVDGYYLYANKISAYAWHDGQKQKLDLKLPKGKVKFDENFGEEVEVFYHALTATADVTDLPNAQYFTLKSQGCADAGLCYPPRTQYFSIQNGAMIEVTKDTFQSFTAVQDATAATPEEAPESTFLPTMLLGALLGGLILNLMPCVFPVLSLKALSLASGDAKTHHRNGWAYTAGIVLSFLLVAIIIIVAKNTGESLGWGFQLQQPMFVAGLVYLFVVLGLNLFGFFEMGTSFMGAGQELTQGDSAKASFFTGVLAAVVASPCTAPFMATAVGFAVTQSAITALLVFTFLGLGLAAPYLLLCYVPAVANRMPNPGPWMERLKQGLSFPMFLTSAWLLGVVGNQTSAKTASILVMGAIAITFAIWVLKGDASTKGRWIKRAFAALSAFAAIWIVVNVDQIDNQENSPWTPYSKQAISDFRSENRPVFVDLTADWCITCKVNENVAINREAVQNFAKENNIALVKGDWTKSDPKITEYLATFGRNGVPLYVMYSSDPSKAPELLPQILTEELVLEAMKKAL